MIVRIPQERDPYERRRLFDLLGVDPAASAEEIRIAYEEQVAKANVSDLEDSERVRRLAELQAAYDVLRESRTRALVEMFLIDEELGREGCRRAAQDSVATSFNCEVVLECEENLLPVEPALKPPAGPPRAVSLGTRMREVIQRIIR